MLSITWSDECEDGLIAAMRGASGGWVSGYILVCMQTAITELSGQRRA